MSEPRADRRRDATLEGVEPVAPGTYLAARVLPEAIQSDDPQVRTMGLDALVLGEVLANRLPIDAEIATALERTVGGSSQVFLNLQADWDAVQAEKARR